MHFEPGISYHHYEPRTTVLEQVGQQNEAVLRLYLLLSLLYAFPGPVYAFERSNATYCHWSQGRAYGVMMDETQQNEHLQWR